MTAFLHVLRKSGARNAAKTLCGEGNGLCAPASGGARKGGFTLIEVLLALAVGMLVMFGCAALTCDMLSLVERLEKGFTLRAHADGVEKFLRGSFLNSVVEDSSEFENVLASNSENTLFMSADLHSPNSSEYFLSFGDVRAHPLYVSPTGFVAERICVLENSDEGLFVVWKFVKSENGDDTRNTYKTLLSPYVTALRYMYFDETSGWKTEDKPLTDASASSLMPRYLLVDFARGDERITKLISLESLSAGRDGK